MTTQDGRARTSKQRYQRFVQDYRNGLLDDHVDAARGLKPTDGSPLSVEGTQPSKWLGGQRREYLGEYLRWLWPHRYGVTAVFALALVGAVLQMVEPLFMRFIIDRVLLNAALDLNERISRLHVAGGLFVAVVIVTQLVNVLKDYRQRL